MERHSLPWEREPRLRPAHCLQETTQPFTELALEGAKKHPRASLGVMKAQ